MTALSLEEIDSEFAAAAGAVRRYRPSTEFDAKLLAGSVISLHEVFGENPSLDERFRWALDSSAYASGFEGWLQHEVISAVSASPPGEDDKPVVVRIADGDEADVRTFEGDSCWFVLLGSGLIAAHAELLDALREIKSAVPAKYEGDDPWCRSDLLGGSRLEELVRKASYEIPYVLALRWLDRFEDEREWELGEIHDWVPRSGGPKHHLDRFDAQIPPEVMVEWVVRAPLRFAAFHGWGSFRTHVFDDRPPDSFWPLSAADVRGQELLVEMEQQGTIWGIDRHYFFPRGSSAIGMGVYLQLARTRRLRAAWREAARLVCLPAPQEPPPGLRRIGAVEAQMRLLNASTHVFAGAEDEDLALLGFASFDEMQVFFGLVSCVVLSQLGAEVNPFQLCTAEWEPIAEFVGKGL